MWCVFALILLGVGVLAPPPPVVESAKPLSEPLKSDPGSSQEKSDPDLGKKDSLKSLVKEIEKTYTPGPTGDSPVTKNEDYLEQEHLKDEVYKEADEETDVKYEMEEDDMQHIAPQPPQGYLPFGMPAFPNWFRLLWFGPRGNPQFLRSDGPQYPPQYPEQRTMSAPDARYLKKMESRRRRRSTDYADPKLVKTIEVPNEDAWWDNVNYGMEDEVKALTRQNAGYATYSAISNQMDHYAPALHVGTINTGEFRNPFLEDPKYRSFGIGSDFNVQDMEAFKFTPQGQHLAFDMNQLEELISSGYLPLGKRLNIDHHLITGYSQCWFGKYVKNMEILGTVDAFSTESRSLYWNQINCGSFKPGTYELLGIKKSYEAGHKGYNNWVIFLKATFGYFGTVAIGQFNPAGLQGASPFLQRTPQQQLTQNFRNEDGEITSSSDKYLFKQAGISHVTGSQYNPSGSRLGFNQDRYQAAHQNGMYDNSVLWSTTTGKHYNPYSLEYTQNSQNLDLVHQPYNPHSQYAHFKPAENTFPPVRFASNE